MVAEIFSLDVILIAPVIIKPGSYQTGIDFNLAVERCIAKFIQITLTL